jgi:hypothetical protein
MATEEFTEGRHAGEAVLSEANFHRSRGNLIIEAGSGVVEANTVLAKGAEGKHKPAAAEDTAVAINIHKVDASGADDVRVAGMVRDCELNGACLEYEASVATDALKEAKHAELEINGIIVR